LNQTVLSTDILNYNEPSDDKANALNGSDNAGGRTSSYEFRPIPFAVWVVTSAVLTAICVGYSLWWQRRAPGKGKDDNGGPGGIKKAKRTRIQKPSTFV
jgi:hypothetical protein